MFLPIYLIYDKFAGSNAIPPTRPPIAEAYGLIFAPSSLPTSDPSIPAKAPIGLPINMDIPLST